jgi:hypothetical protein
MKKKQKRERRERCNSCGKLFKREELFHGPDPFTKEVYDIEREAVLCHKCYSSRVEEV